MAICPLCGRKEADGHEDSATHVAASLWILAVKIEPNKRKKTGDANRLNDQRQIQAKNRAMEYLVKAEEVLFKDAGDLFSTDISVASSPGLASAIRFTKNLHNPNLKRRGKYALTGVDSKKLSSWLKRITNAGNTMGTAFKQMLLSAKSGTWPSEQQISGVSLVASTLNVKVPSVMPSESDVESDKLARTSLSSAEEKHPLPANDILLSTVSEEKQEKKQYVSKSLPPRKNIDLPPPLLRDKNKRKSRSPSEASRHDPAISETFPRRDKFNKPIHRRPAKSTGPSSRDRHRNTPPFHIRPRSVSPTKAWFRASGQRAPTSRFSVVSLKQHVSLKSYDNSATTRPEPVDLPRASVCENESVVSQGSSDDSMPFEPPSRPPPRPPRRRTSPSRRTSPLEQASMRRRSTSPMLFQSDETRKLILKSMKSMDPVSNNKSSRRQSAGVSSSMRTKRAQRRSASPARPWFRASSPGGTQSQIKERKKSHERFSLASEPNGKRFSLRSPASPTHGSYVYKKEQVFGDQKPGASAS